MLEMFIRVQRPAFGSADRRFVASVLGWAAIAMMLGLPAVDAQPPSQRGRQPGRPGPAARQGTPPSVTPGTRNPTTNTAATERPPETLPPGYSPPQTPPDMMTEWTELLTAEDIENYKKIRNKYASALRNGSTSNADKQLIAQGLKYNVQILSMKDQLRELHDRRIELVSRDLQQAGRLLKDATDVRNFRRMVLEQVVKFIEPLLKNNFYTRIQAVTLLGELDLVVEDSIRNLKHETYTPACVPLVKVLSDPEQPTAVKIAAARSIVRLVKFGDVPVELRHQIAHAALNELAKPDTHYWYQMRLAELVSTIDAPLDLQNRKPFIVNGLLAVVRDPKRDFRARTEAAKALGRAALDREVNVAGLNRDLMQLALELATAAQARPEAPEWKQCFFDLYLAYKPLDSADLDAGKKPAGLLNNALTASAAQETYRLILPMVNNVLNNKPIGVPEVQALQAWLQTNTPNAGKVAPVSNASGPNPTTVSTTNASSAK